MFYPRSLTQRMTMMAWGACLCALAFGPLRAGAVLPIEVPGVLVLSQDAPASGHNVYAITDEPGGLYRSANGTDWVQLALTLPNTHFSSITATPNGTLYSTSSDGLLRSTDNGRTWRTIQAGDAIFFLVCANDGSLLARTWKKGLLRSEDGGVNWYPVGGEFAGPVLTLLQDGKGALWAATFGGGIYRSTDNGITWEKNGLDRGYVITLALDAHDTLYAGTYHNGIYRHDSLGWMPVNEDLPAQATIQKLANTPLGLVAIIAHHGLYLAQTNGRWQLITGAPAPIEEITGVLPLQDGQWLVATRPHGLFRVNPTTRTWISIPFHVNVRTAAADPCGGVYAALSSGALLHTNPLDGGLPVHQCENRDTRHNLGHLPSNGGDVLLITQNGTILAGGTLGLFLRRPQEEIWRHVALLHSDPVVTCLAETQHGWIVGTRSNGVLRSTDGGATWLPLTEGGQIRACAAHGVDVYATTHAGFSVSHDGGTTWTHQGISPSPTFLATDQDRDVIVAHASRSGNREELSESTGDDAPLPLILDESGEALLGNGVRAIAVAGNMLYVAAAQGVDLFQRKGVSWHWEGQMLPQVAVNALVPLSDDRIAVACNWGLFVLHHADDAIQIPLTRPTASPE